MRRTIRVALGENARELGMLRFDAHGAREYAVFDYDAASLGGRRSPCDRPKPSLWCAEAERPAAGRVITLLRDEARSLQLFRG